MAVANALQPEAARATPALFGCNYDAMTSLKVAEPMNCRIIAFLLPIHYSVLWPWPLIFDIEHLQCIAYDVIKLCTKFEHNRAIHGRVIAISVFDLITLNIAIFTKFDLQQLINAWIIAFFDADPLGHPVTGTYDPLTLKVRGTSASRDQVCTKFEQNRVRNSWLLKLVGLVLSPPLFQLIGWPVFLPASWLADHWPGDRNVTAWQSQMSLCNA